jgi:hypothetical protein
MFYFFALISYTSAAQSSLRSFLQDEGADFKNASGSRTEFVPNDHVALAQQFGSELAEIMQEVAAQLGPIVKTTPAQETKDVLPTVVRGVWVVGGDKLWARNIIGEGLVVSNIETGVRGGHEILKANFRGDYR